MACVATGEANFAFLFGAGFKVPDFEALGTSLLLAPGGCLKIGALQGLLGEGVLPGAVTPCCMGGLAAICFGGGAAGKGSASWLGADSTFALGGGAKEALLGAAGLGLSGLGTGLALA